MQSATDPALERACGIVAFKDSQPLRRALFAQKAARTPAIRAALRAWDHLGSGRAAAAFVAVFAAKCFLELRPPAVDACLLGVWQYPNEERQLAALAALDPTLAIASITFDRGAARDRGAWSLALGQVRDVPAAWGILADYARRGDFLIAARVASTVGYYLRMLPLLRRSRARAVVVSSDANPYAVALVHAARQLGRRSCFVTHGHVAEEPPRLDFDLSILDGPVLRDVYERAGPILGRVVYRGAEGVVRPMDTTRLRRGIRTLGVVLSILVDWPRASATIARLRAIFAPVRVVLRLHPNREMRDPDWARHLDLRGVVVSDGDRKLTDDAADCELVACGNSSAHLTVLKYGVPSIYVGDLDEVADDYYGFVHASIVPRLPKGSAMTREQIADFYEDRGWPGRFARFDAAYPDRQAICDREVADALRTLIE